MSIKVKGLFDSAKVRPYRCNRFIKILNLHFSHLGHRFIDTDGILNEHTQRPMQWFAKRNIDSKFEGMQVFFLLSQWRSNRRLLSEQYVV